MRLVLASRSASRVALLKGAGVAFDMDPADVDEDAIGNAVAEPAARALALAIAKAQRVSARQPGRLVLGGDQVCTLEGSGFVEKPRDPEDHVRMLAAMAGKTHTFFPAAALVEDGKVLARIGETVRVTFRAFSVDVARAYVAAGEGKGSCGGYEIEGKGAQLVANIDGTMHAIMGLPLLGILAALRDRGDVDGLLR